MRKKPFPSLCALLAGVAIVINPMSAQAGGTSHAGSSRGSVRAPAAGPNCHPGQTGGGNISINKPVSINTKINVYKPVNINTNINVNKNIDESKNININKPVTITKNIDNSKNININTNIDASKNININKNIVINNGGSADAAALAEAIAQSSASASVNVYGSANASSNAASQSFVGGGMVPEAPSVYIGGDIGNIAIEASASVAAAPAQCVEQEAAVMKAIHALCISADNHEFPASHMIANTWIEASYEGEVARCIPGSHLKVIVGQVVQSSEGLASAQSSGQVLECAAHEALRHYKDGMLKCAPAVKVPDCTERTNLRKFGTNDMFFTYRAKLCLETSGSAQASVRGGMSREQDASWRTAEDRQHSDVLRQEFAN